MIEVNLYRYRIGSFYQTFKNKKLRFMKYGNPNSMSQKTGKMTLSTLQFIMKLLLLLAFLPTPFYNVPVFTPQTSGTTASAQTATWTPALGMISCWMLPTTAYSRSGTAGSGGTLIPSLGMLFCWMLPTTAYPRRHTVLCGRGGATQLSTAQSWLQFQVLGKKETSNFLAKCLHGNIKKGIKNFHLNVRSLSNKVSEIKKLVKEHTPHIFGLSECEIRKVDDYFDEARLKVPGYQVIFPKSWAQNGVARILVYVKKGFEFEQLQELEDERVQSIWLRGGFKNGKRIYFCHGYREHTSSLGNTLSAQRTNLELFLYQWELAAEHNTPTDPNEIHISGDMNLDCLNGRWLDPGYHLLTLSRLVQNICNTHNFTQLVKEPTRLQYNSVQDRTDISCIDHVYTNTKHRCSDVSVTSFGNSDHDMISYTRYSKEPPVPARTMRKRSYKNFDEKKYLEDLAKVDWSDVLYCDDLDVAAEILTRKLRNLLNVHAPWIVFQQRKFFVPYLTEETKKLMMQRDKLKQEAKDLALRDKGRHVSVEQRLAWENYKKLRNKINNSKKHDEKNYKSRKISEDLQFPDRVWKTAKSFMGWKSTGTPNQLEVDGKLETKASKIAQVMNDFFIDKVQAIRNGLRQVPENLVECLKIMRGKRCSLVLNHVTVDTVCKLLKQLKSGTSASVDELDSYAVKLSADYIAKPLHHIITLSIMQSKFPTGWKNTKLIPLHKKLDKLDRKNYRPIAILSPLSKVLEKVV